MTRQLTVFDFLAKSHFPKVTKKTMMWTHGEHSDILDLEEASTKTGLDM